MPSERDSYGNEYVLNQEHWNHIGRGLTGPAGIEKPVKQHQPPPLMADNTVVSGSKTWTVQNESRLHPDEVWETPVTVSVECHEDKYEQEVAKSDEDSDTSEIADDYCTKENPSGPRELINVSEEDTVVSEAEPMSLDSEDFTQNVSEKIQHELSTKQLEFLKKVAFHKWALSQQLSQIRQQMSMKIARTLLHNSDCLGCDTCKVPEMMNAHREICHNISCEVCKMVDFARMLHSTDCTKMSCKVNDCARNKQEFDALVKDVALEHEYTVEYSRTSLFEEGTKLYKNLDFCFLTERFINEGSYGKVYRVHFFAPGSGVEADLAVKESIPKKDFLGFTERYPAKQQAEMFRRLATHPNIASPLLILCNSRDGGTLIIMERQSHSLYDLQTKYREDGKGLPFGDALYYVNQIVGAVAELHDKRIVHKDIKGKNILLDETQQKALLTDFDGCLLLYALDSSVCESVKGTRGFIAPEVEMRESHGTKADIYSIGCLFIDLIIGINPEGNHGTRIEKVNCIEAWAPEVGQMIRRCLELNPEDRPTAKDLLNECIMKDCGKVTPTLQFDVNSHAAYKLNRQQKNVVVYAPLALKLEMLEKMDDSSVLETMERLEKTLPLRHMPETFLGTEELIDVS